VRGQLQPERSAGGLSFLHPPRSLHQGPRLPTPQLNSGKGSGGRVVGSET